MGNTDTYFPVEALLMGRGGFREGSVVQSNLNFGSQQSLSDCRSSSWEFKSQKQVKITPLSCS